MKKRLLSLIVISALSLSLMVGCTSTNDAAKDTPETNVSESQTDTDAGKEAEPTTENASDSDTVGSEDISNEDSIKETFTEVLTKLYNTDYSVEENKAEAKEYARSTFSEEGFEEFLKNLNDYDSEFSSSDLLITKVTEIKNDNSSYVKAYEVRYNVTITAGKPSSYTDLIGVVWEDKDGKLFINSINQSNF